MKIHKKMQLYQRNSYNLQSHLAYRIKMCVLIRHTVCKSLVKIQRCRHIFLGFLVLVQIFIKMARGCPCSTERNSLNFWFLNVKKVSIIILNSTHNATTHYNVLLAGNYVNLLLHMHYKVDNL